MITVALVAKRWNPVHRTVVPYAGLRFGALIKSLGDGRARVAWTDSAETTEEWVTDLDLLGAFELPEEYVSRALDLAAAADRVKSVALTGNQPPTPEEG